jgi:NADPH:quinone reductase-like Zn-dependent oxidoreductase
VYWPSTVLQKCEEQIPDSKADEILVKTLAAPINPADINTIQGKIDLFQILSFVTLTLLFLSAGKYSVKPPPFSSRASLRNPSWRLIVLVVKMHWKLGVI